MEMMGFLGAGNNPMVGMTVSVAVAVEEALKKSSKNQHPGSTEPGCFCSIEMEDLFFWDILHNIAHIALQNAAKCVDSMGANTFISFQTGDLPGADAILLDQGILCDAFLFHCKPKFFVGNHIKHFLCT